jgi:hypothetical protein
MKNSISAFFATNYYFLFIIFEKNKEPGQIPGKIFSLVVCNSQKLVKYFLNFLFLFQIQKK